MRSHGRGKGNMDLSCTLLYNHIATKIEIAKKLYAIKNFCKLIYLILEKSTSSMSKSFFVSFVELFITIFGLKFKKKLCNRNIFHARSNGHFFPTIPF